MPAQQSNSATVLILANPTAGRGLSPTFVADLSAGLRQCQFRPVYTESRIELKQHVDETASRGDLRAVVAMGGDGTVASVASIVDGRSSIVPVPSGTENLLACHFGYTTRVPDILALIESGVSARIDVGRANGRIFLNMVSAGFDAEVVRRVHEARRGTISRWSYAQPIVNAAQRYVFPSMTVKFDQVLSDHSKDTSLSLETHWAFAFNLNCYARGLRISPRAQGNDGKLDLALFRTPNVMKGMFDFLTVLSRCHGRWSGCQRFQCTRLTIESPHVVPFQLDGDPGGTLPVAVEVLPSHTRILLPDRLLYCT